MRIPNRLLVVSILLLALGVMGLLAAPLSCMGTLLGQATGDLPQQPGISQAAFDAQEELQRRLQWMTVPTLLVSVLTGLLAIVLVAGGGGTLARKAWGLQLLRIGATAGLAVATSKLILAIVNGVLAWGPTMDLVDALASEGPPPPPDGLATVLSATTYGGLILGFLMGLTWYAVKMALYLTAIRTLRSEETRAFRDALDAA